MPKPTTSEYIRGSLYGLGAVSIWASWIVAARLGVKTSLQPWDLVAIRFLIAGLILLPYLLKKGLAVDRLGWAGLAAIVVGGGAPAVLVAYGGLLFAPAAHAASLFTALIPLYVGMLAAVVLGEAFTVAKRIGLALVVAGALGIVWGAGGTIGTRDNIGDAMFISAGLLFAGYTVAMRKARLDGLHAAAIAAVGSLIIYVPIYAVNYGSGLFNAPWGDIALQAFVQGFLTAVISLLLYGRAVSILGASDGSTFAALAPVMTAMLAIPILGEWPATSGWISMLLISGGVYIASGGVSAIRWVGDLRRAEPPQHVPAQNHDVLPVIQRRSVATTEPTIVQETISAIESILGDDLNHIRIERAAIGLFFTGVKLDTGVAGACATPPRNMPEAACCPSSASAMPFPDKLSGRLARDLLQEARSDGAVRSAVGIATMNALADMCWRRHPSENVVLREGVDAYAAAAIQPGERVVVIGAFLPFLKPLKRERRNFTVLDLDPASLKADELPFYRPANQASEVLPTADVVLIAGATLVNDTLENLMAFCRPSTRLAIVGPTIGLMPDPLLRRGANMLGGIRVTKPDTFLDGLMEGGSGYYLLGRSAEKFVLLGRETAAWSRAA